MRFPSFAGWFQLLVLRGKKNLPRWIPKLRTSLVLLQHRGSPWIDSECAMNDGGGQNGGLVGGFNPSEKYHSNW